MNRSLLLAAALVLLSACDDKKEGDTKTAASASASATTAATTPSATASATASAAPSATASAASDTPTSTKDPQITVRDPEKETSKSVKAQIGGTVTLYLPKWAGTTWTVKEGAKPLGKPKEETMPGFAGPTPAASFVWTLKDPSLKPGQKLEAKLENKSSDKAKAAEPGKPFSLTIELVAP